MERQSLVAASSLLIGYSGSKHPTARVAGPLDLALHAGELICLLGPNGCGKSTLLRTLAGLQAPLEGTVHVGAKSISKLRPIDIARNISLVLTDSVRTGNLDVYSVIALGRYPYSGWLGNLSPADKEVISHAAAVTGTTAFLARQLSSLSDGECQKVMLARAIAQDTPVIILDEPTAHLDLPSRIQLTRLLHQLAKNSGKAIVMSTHELDLALHVADQIWLLDSSGGFSAGLPEALVLDGAMERAFARDGLNFDISTGSFELHPAGGKTIAVTGEGNGAYWTRRALRRLGYIIVKQTDDNITVTVTSSGSIHQWSVGSTTGMQHYHSMQAFLRAL